jgi:hypothetical protein
VLAAILVDQPARRRLEQPRTRIVRKAVLGPAQRRRQQRLLDRVFRPAEVAVAPRQRAEDLRRRFAQQALDLD